MVINFGCFTVYPTNFKLEVLIFSKNFHIYKRIVGCIFFLHYKKKLTAETTSCLNTYVRGDFETGKSETHLNQLCCLVVRAVY